jgi:hypothetical protein
VGQNPSKFTYIYGGTFSRDKTQEETEHERRDQRRRTDDETAGFEEGKKIFLKTHGINPVQGYSPKCSIEISEKKLR